MSRKRVKYNDSGVRFSKVAVGTREVKGTVGSLLGIRDLDDIIWGYVPVPWASELLAHKFIQYNLKENIMCCGGRGWYTEKIKIHHGSRSRFNRLMYKYIKRW